MSLESTYVRWKIFGERVTFMIQVFLFLSFFIPKQYSLTTMHIAFAFTKYLKLPRGD